MSLQKRLPKELRENYEEISFATTKLEFLLDAKYNGNVWLPIDEAGGCPEETIKPVVLSSL